MKTGESRPRPDLALPPQGQVFFLGFPSRGEAQFALAASRRGMACAWDNLIIFGGEAPCSVCEQNKQNWEPVG